MEASMSIKSELDRLTLKFSGNNSRLQIIDLKQDEFSCKLTLNSDKKYFKFKIKISDNYPTTSAVWTTDSDKKEIVSFLESLPSLNTTITSQMEIIFAELCRVNNCSLPKKTPPLEGNKDAPIKDKPSDSEDTKRQTMLEALMQKHLQDTSKGFSMGTRRLKNELLKIWRSEPYKKQHFTIDLINDSLYEWHVLLLPPAIDSSSLLYNDLIALKKSTGQEGILLHFVFKDNYPLEPPFVRVANPVIKKGHVFEVGGVMCMELLMDQGWIPALSIEAVILQIAATLVRGEGRINFAASKEEYTLERAQLGFEKLKSLPDRSRWTSKFEDG